MKPDEPDDDSTLVRSGKLAMTYSEMAAFVKDIEDRPAERLLNDLESLVALPEAKYQLVAMVLRKKARAVSTGWPALLERLNDLGKNAEDATVRSRAQAFLDTPSS